MFKLTDTHQNEILPVVLKHAHWRKWRERVKKKYFYLHFHKCRNCCSVLVNISILNKCYDTTWATWAISHHVPNHWSSSTMTRQEKAADRDSCEMADTEKELLVRMRETGAHARCNRRQGRRNVTLRRCLVDIQGDKEDMDKIPHVDLEQDWMMACAFILVPITTLLRFIFFKRHPKVLFQFLQDLKWKDD